ncbi:MAG TPA: ROK family protein, partial [Tepidisphaeraceae bacterium]|nr:ROK family protein [Tepidisphaeraceae bacterium]
IEGRLLRGRHSQAGNLAGHFVIDPAGFPCVCGGRGCAEAQQHLSAMSQIAAADKRFAASPLSQTKTLDYAAIFKSAESDPLAHDLRDRAIGVWGAVVTSMINQFDCEQVIVGGGIMRSADVIMPALQAAAGRACTPWGTAQIHPAALGDHAALLGMAVLLNEQFEYV